MKISDRQPIPFYRRQNAQGLGNAGVIIDIIAGPTISSQIGNLRLGFTPVDFKIFLILCSILWPPALLLSQTLSPMTLPNMRAPLIWLFPGAFKAWLRRVRILPTLG